MSEKIPKSSKEGGNKKIGASDEARTHDIHLGKVMLYQLSYTRNW